MMLIMFVEFLLWRDCSSVDTQYMASVHVIKKIPNIFDIWDLDN